MAIKIGIATPIDDHSGIVDGDTGIVTYKTGTSGSYAGKKNIPTQTPRPSDAVTIDPIILCNNISVEPGTEVQAKMTRITPSQQFSGKKKIFSPGNIIYNV